MTNEVKIMCKNCKHWGGNNQKVINSTGCSKCLVLKKMAHACQHCTGHYEPKEKKQGLTNPYFFYKKPIDKSFKFML